MKIDKKELKKHLPPCEKCGLCENHPCVRRGDWECSELIDHQAKKVIERDCQRLWALSDLWNLAFAAYCLSEGSDEHDITVWRMMKASTMSGFVRRAKAIIRMTDVDQIKKLRKELSDRYHGVQQLERGNP